MNKPWCMVLCGLLAIDCAAVNAQAVYVDSHPQGMQSSRLTYTFKEQLRRSSTLKVVDDEKDSAMQVRLSAMDIEPNSYQTVYSVVWTFSQPGYPSGLKFYNNSNVGICGSSRIAECSDTLAAETDDFATQLRQFMRQAFSQKQ